MNEIHLVGDLASDCDQTFTGVVEIQVRDLSLITVPDLIVLVPFGREPLTASDGSILIVHDLQDSAQPEIASVVVDSDFPEVVKPNETVPSAN
jgi:hypothetical protein